MTPTLSLEAIGTHIRAYIELNWQPVLAQHRKTLEDAWAKHGDAAYGGYLYGWLFGPLSKWLKANDLRAAPALPGNFMRSREWGVTADGRNQQRWMWSLVSTSQGRVLGAVVTVVHHDHTRFYLPQVPKVFWIEAISNHAVRDALVALSPDFAAAPDAELEVAAELGRGLSKRKTHTRGHMQPADAAPPLEAFAPDSGFIHIRGARENNLKHVSVDIPRHKLTVFTGVSGSGKSSLVFDTIAAEAQRQLNETFTAFVQTFLPNHGHPNVDQIANLNAPIIIDQKRVGGGARSTVGTFTDINALLRLLFSRIGEPEGLPAFAYSFNHPIGMCLECDGIGVTTQVNLDTLLDRSKSLNGGAILHPEFKVGKWMWKHYTLSGLFDNDKSLAAFTQAELDQLLHGADARVSFGEFGSDYEGLVERFTRMYIRKDMGAMSDRNRAVFEHFVITRRCPVCDGARLNRAALASKINGLNIAEMADLEITRLMPLLNDIGDPVGERIAGRLLERLNHMAEIGLGYLSLARKTATLSGGESHRLKLIRHLGNALTDMLYVLDEPSIGLHARDVARLNSLLTRLRDKGNTVLVVEHDPDVIARADHIIDLGPLAGARGGEVVYAGDVAGLSEADTLTGRFLRHALPIKTTVRTPKGWLPIRHARLNNLKDISVDIPAGVFTVVSGVAGSGKSTLINDVFVAQHPEALVIDQARVGANARSAPVTYVGIMDDIRAAFARASGARAALFSFNAEGSCPNCNGLGVVYTDLAFMDGISSPCDVCEGRRFKPEVLAHTLRGKTISEVLMMTVEDALVFFGEKKIKPVLQAMFDVGLGYLPLGQPLSALSGGEVQRLKLATELHKSGSLVVMDEPTTGLHLSDIGQLMTIINRLVDAGNTVVVIEHHLDVIRQADWVIDLGPEGGVDGGEVLFEGPPAALQKCAQSLTAKYL